MLNIITKKIRNLLGIENLSEKISNLKTTQRIIETKLQQLEVNVQSIERRERELFERREILAIARQNIIDFRECDFPNIYCINPSLDWSKLICPVSPSDQGVRLGSGFCNLDQLNSVAFRYWLSNLKIPWSMHRKKWELAFILQALYERGLLGKGKRGLGFAVGEEPLPAFMASCGCEVVATDLDESDDRAKPWGETAQLATSIKKLYRPNICQNEIIDKMVTFRPVDMNRIPADLTGYDFTWSTCSFEHCGSIQLGIDFLANQMSCLKSGGVAVHTTEFNLSSLEESVTEGPTVIFRKKDIEQMVAGIQDMGHKVELISTCLGQRLEDELIDIMPYTSNGVHLKLLLFDKYISTSIALVITKK